MVTNLNTESQYFAVLYQDDNGNWGRLAGIGLPHARPGSATPLRVPLVPEFRECTTPNSTHVGPLNSPSCTPATLDSSLLTTSTIGKGVGSVLFKSQVGNPGTPADEADLSISASMTDVRESGGADYSGPVVLTTRIRVTDTGNGVSGGVPGTMTDADFSVPVSCTPNSTADLGSLCDISTSADTLVPGFMKEGKRTVISALSVSVRDRGIDGSLVPSPDPIGLGCPPTCGSGDEKVFLRQGVFTP